jgi:hypothetical protein
MQPSSFLLPGTYFLFQVQYIMFYSLAMLMVTQWSIVINLTSKIIQGIDVFIAFLEQALESSRNG